jgi:uncharacterized protein (TIRG00374 family)
MQQQSQAEVQVSRFYPERRIRPTRLIRPSFKASWQDGRATARVIPTIDEGDPVCGRGDAKGHSALDARPLPLDTSDEDIDISLLDTLHLLEVSGMLRAIQVKKQRTGALSSISIDGHKTAGQVVPFIPLTTVPTPQEIAPLRFVPPQPAWRTILSAPTTKVILGLVIGIGLLFLIAHFVNVSQTLHTLQQTLTTPQGIALALLSGIAFLTAFSIRGIRWKLFLNPIGKISNFRAVQLFLIGIFLNFLLPVRGGEVAKSLMLKRIAGIPVSQSLPTTVMDRSLDLMPALFIITIVPLLGIQMDVKLWLVLGTVSGLLIGVIFFTVLAAWKRTMAIKLLQKITGMLPKAIGNKIAGFTTGFVDALLAGASQPKIFLPALLLTGIAVMFDGLFAMLAFWTVGMHIPYTTAIFGYTVYNMFYILPTPPAQVGSNEAAGVLVFSGLLHLNQSGVLAMFVFSHPWAALLMCSTGMLSLSSLGLTISSATRVQTEL